MTGAMYAAISGLKTHMSKLNVIGNNVANVNTYGYKSARCTFQEALYTTSRNGSDGSATVGGRNPSQIGYGSEIRSIDLNMTGGNYAPTISSDCMLTGEGFFLVGDKDITFEAGDAATLKRLTLTRVGDFDFHGGYLTDSQGNVVYGFPCSKEQVDDGTNSGQVETKAVGHPTLTPIRLPLAATDGSAVYPTYNATTGLMEYPKPGDEVPGKTGVKVTDKPIAVDSLKFDEATGMISGTNKDTEDIEVIGYLALGVPENPAGVSHTSGSYYKCSSGAGDLRIVSLGGAVSGYINSTDATTTGPAGMRIGDSGGTELVTGGLELSNADLATEISEMITTQRGYQANTRIITVTDSMLEELVNMKR